MVKNYFYIILFFLSIAVTDASAQEGKPRPQESTIEGLSFYPNPVSNGKIYITSKSSSDKQVTIFDVLGKKVLTQLTSKELNVSSLSPGVYIIKIEEGDSSATRKLIVR
jgi:Secretion system C-terminal sorting domain